MEFDYEWFAYERRLFCICKIILLKLSYTFQLLKDYYANVFK